MLCWEVEKSSPKVTRFSHQLFEISIQNSPQNFTTHFRRHGSPNVYVVFFISGFPPLEDLSPPQYGWGRLFSEVVPAKGLSELVMEFSSSTEGMSQMTE